ncbi:MAG: nucleotidyltransferase family protein [Bacteroidales bacterium]|nr:nucleotidyltransferase family protein [Bacteroidales bacterium]
MINEAIVLAGGFGTRLKQVVEDLPKPMAAINGKPFLEYQFDFLKRYKIERIVLSVGYRADMIMDYFRDNYRDMDIVYAVEKEPLGTGGGVVNAFKMIRNDAAFVLNGDSIFDIDLHEFCNYYIEKEADACMALKYLDAGERYGRVEINDSYRVTAFIEKNSSSGKGYINGGIYIIAKGFQQYSGLKGNFSLEKDFFEEHSGSKVIFGIPFDSYFIDIGIPEEFQRAQHEFTRFKY